MEMGNMSKRQKPDQRTEISRMPPMGLPHSKKIPHSQASLDPSIKMDVILANVEKQINSNTHIYTQLNW